jgi:hypothetical protein
MPSNTPNVGAPLWAASQASPWLTESQAARIWDAFAVTVIVERKDLTSPPGACADGARYLVNGVATGLWAGHDGDLAIAVGANASNGWYFAEIGLQGMLLYNRAEARNYRYESGVWTAFADTLSRFQDLLDVTISGLADGDLFVWDASNGLLFPQTVANLIAPILTSYVLASLDTDVTLAANSDARVASQKAIKTYVDNAVTGLLDLKGGQDCSANPNYPAASKGDYYFVTVAGKIGGASGTSVLAGDIFFASADNAGGTQAGVGSSWDVMHTSSLVGALLAANNLSDLGSAPTALTNLGGTTVGKGVFTAANPSAITFFRVNADNSVSLLSASAFRTAIGAGTGSGSGDMLAANNLSDLSNIGTARTNLGLLRLIATFFTTAPTASEVLAIYIAVDAFTLAANLSGSQVSVGTNPAGTFAIDIQKNGSTIATISISTLGVATLTTSGGTAKSIAAGDIIKLVAPAGVDATIANVAITLKGTL